MERAGVMPWPPGMQPALWSFAVQQFRSDTGDPGLLVGQLVRKGGEHHEFNGITYRQVGEFPRTALGRHLQVAGLCVFHQDSLPES